MLLRQIFACVLKSEYKIYTKKFKYKTFTVKITKTEMIEIKIMFNKYTEALEKEIDILI